MKFGMSLMLDPPVLRPVELGVMGEQAGFDYVWVFDSHILWQDPIPAMTLLSERTERVKIGTCVTNPVTRDWTVTASAFATLQELSRGRIVCGIGRGDSALRAMGRKTTTLKSMEEAVLRIKALARGEQVQIGEAAFEFPWAINHEFPVYIAAYGPKALAMAGRIADGVIIQIADPFIVDWCLGFVRQGADEAGRSMDDIHVQVCGAGFVSNDLEAAREHVRWFPALVSNHIMDLIDNHDPQGLPDELVEFAKLRTRDTYDYREHARATAKHASFVPDEVVDRFTVIGDVEQCVNKIEELRRVGVDEWNIYLNAVPEQEQLLQAYGQEIIPRFQQG